MVIVTVSEKIDIDKQRGNEIILSLDTQKWVSILLLFPYCVALWDFVYSLKKKLYEQTIYEINSSI